MSDNSNISVQSLFRVDGLVAVITGGGTGIGSYFARALAVNGAAKVFIIGRREEPLKKVAASVDTNNIVPLVGDVTSKESLMKCVEAVKSQVDHIDVLVPNAGVNGPYIKMMDQNFKPLPVADLAANLFKPELSEVDSTYTMNVTSVHFTLAAFLPLLEAANKNRGDDKFKPRPQVITVTSVAGFSRRPATNLSYGPSKAALVHLTKNLVTGLIPYDIRANQIAPGIFVSELSDEVFQTTGLGEYNKEWNRWDLPAGRCGYEEDMAGPILFLCSRAGGYINGNVLLADGGRLSVIPAVY